jgi:hypothetical protein
MTASRKTGPPDPRASELADAEHVRLLDAQQREVILQPKVAARWQDGSVKWLHISFLAATGAKSTAKYTLEYGSEVSRAPQASPLTWIVEGNKVTVRTERLIATAGSPRLRLTGEKHTAIQMRTDRPDMLPHPR